MKHKIDPDIAPLGPGPGLGILRSLCILALGLSGYLLWGSVTGERLLGCGVESGCGAVLNSRWAYLFGVPVSLPALVLYVAVLGATGLLERARNPLWRRRARGFLISAAAALLGAALWFIGLQVFVLGTICPFCITAHACGLLVAVLVFLNTPNETGGVGTKKREAMARVPRAQLVFVGFMAVAIMAGGQILYRPKAFAVVSAPELAVRKARRILQLHGDLFQLDLSNVPLLGSLEAPSVIVHLFDYSCSHCRAVHPILLQAFRSLSNQLAVVSLPVPLATNCNPLIKQLIPAHINACAYAWSGLAVWRANPAKLSAFDDWIFAPNRPPSPEAVQAEAMRLVGTNEFKQALSDPWIQQQLDFSIRLYETNYLRYRKQALPELMIGTNIVSGSVANVNDLYKLLGEQLDLRLPADPPRSH